MAKNTKIIATIVPNGIKSDDELQFSVFLSPRLSNSGRLIDYYEVLHWQKFAEFFYRNDALKLKFIDQIPNFSLEVRGIEHDWSYMEKQGLTYKSLKKGNADQDSEAKKFSKEDRADFYSFYQKKIWSNLYNGFTPVERWLLNEYDREKVTPLLNAAQLKKDIRENKDAIVQSIREYLSANMPGELTYDSLDDPSELLLQEGLDKEVARRIKDLVVLYRFLENKETKNDDQMVSTVIADRYSFLKKEGVVILEASQYFAKPETNLHEDEVDLLNKENQEFHRKFSIMADYPHLMRLTGWIFDFTIKLTQDEIKELSGPNNNLFISLEMIDNFNISNRNSAVPIAEQFNESELLNFLDEVEFKCPWTAVHLQVSGNNENHKLDKFTFRYRDEDKYLSVKEGYIKTVNEAGGSIRIEAKQENVLLAGARLDLEGSNDRIGEKEYKKLKDDNATLPKEERIEEFGQSEGIGIYIMGNDQKMGAGQKAFDYKKDINDMGVFGQDLDVGYRIDLVNATADKTKVYSLCKRVSTYVVDNNPLKESKNDQDNFMTLLKNYQDEGWVQESHQLDDSGALIVQDEVARWNNWSLVCPYQGDYRDFNENEEVKRDRFFHDLEIVDSRPVPGSLPILKFGNKYQFRLSMVDICGNGVPFEERKNINPNVAQVGGQGFWTTPVTYKRKEPVQIPNIFLDNSERTLKDYNGRNRFSFKDNNNDGEDLYTMVVRSSFKNGKLVTDHKPSVRWMAPTRVSFQFMLQTGVLDKLFKNSEYRKQILKHETPKFAGSSKEILVTANDEVKYFWDPAVFGFMGSLESDPVKHLDETDFVEKFQPKNSSESALSKNLLQAKFNKIELKGTNGNGAEVEEISLKASNGKMTIELPKGREDVLSLNSRINNYIFPDIDESKLQKQRIKVIHATQRPIRIDYPLLQGDDLEFKEVINYKKQVENIERAPETIVLKPKITFSSFPVLTVETYRLHITYEKVVIDYDQPGGYRVEKNTKVLGGFFPLDSEQQPLLKEKDTIFDGDWLVHDFGDTQHRLVDYKIEAISRFREYFKDSVKDFSIFGKAQLLLDHKKLISPRTSEAIYTTNIPSSKRPEPPVIDRFVPIIAWAEKKGEVQRSHEVFRVYFKNDFYSSGLDECIAVFIKEGEHTVLDRFNGLVSQMGSDPIHGPGKGENVRNGFRANHFSIAPELKGIVIHDQSPKSDWKFNSTDPGEGDKIDPTDGEALDYSVLDRNSPGDIVAMSSKAVDKDNNYHIGCIPFLLEYDTELRQWYVDIKLNSDFVDEYMPFMQFAIATYQPNAIYTKEYDYRFSKVISTPFAPVLPKRKVTVDGGQLIISKGLRSDKTEFWVFQKESNKKGIIDLKHEEVGILIEKKVSDQNNGEGETVTISKNNELTFDFGSYLHLQNKTLIVEEYEKYDDLVLEQDNDTKVYYFKDPNGGYTKKDGSFVGAQKDSKEKYSLYSPRNDYRRRLVFQCEIK